MDGDEHVLSSDYLTFLTWLYLTGEGCRRMREDGDVCKNYRQALSIASKRDNNVHEEVIITKDPSSKGL